MPWHMQVRQQYGVKKDLLGLLEGRETYVIGKDGTVKLVRALPRRMLSLLVAMPACMAPFARPGLLKGSHLLSSSIELIHVLS